jgi:trans-2,3-dihydro-3-hydroxyanthranilate isomerase
VIGSTFALAELGVIKPQSKSFVFGLGVGPTKVELTWEGDRLAFAWMDQGLPKYNEPVSTRADIIKAVGLKPSSVEETGLPIEEISCGNAFLIIPVKSRKAVDAAEADLSKMRKLKSAFPGGHVGALFFSTDTGDESAVAYSRMFAPSAGVIEDPATGSAAGPLGCYLVRHRLVGPDRLNDMVNLQGVAMGRASRLHMRIALDTSGLVTRVQVGGRAVRVGEGVIDS